MASLQSGQFLFCAETDPSLNPQAVPAVSANAPAKPNNLPPADPAAQAVAAQTANFQSGAISPISSVASDLPPVYKRLPQPPSPIALAYASALQTELGAGYRVGCFKNDTQYSNKDTVFTVTQVAPTPYTFGSMSFTASVRPETGVTVDPTSIYIRYPIPALPPTTIPGGISTMTTKDMPVYRPPTPNGNPGDPVRPTINDGLEGPIPSGNSTGGTGAGIINRPNQFEQIPQQRPIVLPGTPVPQTKEYTPNWGPAFYQFLMSPGMTNGNSISAIAALTKITIASVSPKSSYNADRFANFTVSYGKPPRTTGARIRVNSKGQLVS